jgi:hypothetical protein
MFVDGSCRALSTFARPDASLLWIIQTSHPWEKQLAKTILLGSDYKSEMGRMEESRKYAKGGGNEEICG